MPSSNPILVLTRQAAADMTGARAVTFANGYPASNGARVMGVIFSTGVASGDFFPVVVAGTVPVESGAAIPDGSEVIADTQGRAIPATGTAGEQVFADALMPAAQSGQYVNVLLRR